MIQHRYYSFFIRVGMICALLVLSLGLVNRAAAAAPSLYVSPEGLDTNVGTSPGLPYKTLQHA